MATYTVEYAASGRSKCKESGELIPKGEVRIAKVTEMERDGESMTMMAWYRVVPFFQMMKRMRKKENYLQSASDLGGFSELQEDDQQMLEKLVTDFYDPDVDFPPEKPKKKKTRDSEESSSAASPAPPKKKPKKSLEPVAPESREVSKDELKAFAEEMAARCRVRGLDLPSDPDAARQKVGRLVVESRRDGVVDIAALIKAADEQFGVKVSVECACAENEGLATAFSEMAGLYFKQGERMKGASYKKVSGVLAGLTSPVTSGKECQKLPGVGKASGEKIDEFLATGKITKLEELKNS